GAPRGLRVLAVADHAATAPVLRDLLRHHAYTAEVAASLADAMSITQSQRFDVVICDIGLPDGDGCDLMRHLKNSCPETRGIALTGYGMEQDIQRSTGAGFAAHLTKPVDAATLAETIARVAAG